MPGAVVRVLADDDDLDVIELAGVQRREDLVLGRIHVDAAEALIAHAIPAPDEAYYSEALSRALDATAAAGLTGVHEAGVPLDVLPLYQQFAADGRFPIRNYAMITPPGIAPFCDANPDGIDEPRLVVRSVKVYADGALGSRGAAARGLLARRLRLQEVCSESLLRELTTLVLAAGSGSAAAHFAQISARPASRWRPAPAPPRPSSATRRRRGSARTRCR